MKRAVLARLVLASSALAAGSASLFAVTVASELQGPLTGREEALDKTLGQVEAAQVELVRGRPAAFKALWS